MNHDTITPWMLPIIKKDALVASHVFLKLRKKQDTQTAHSVALADLTLPNNAPAAQRDLFNSSTNPLVKQAIIQLIHDQRHSGLSEAVPALRQVYEKRLSKSFDKILGIHSRANCSTPPPNRAHFYSKFQEYEMEHAVNHQIHFAESQEKLQIKKATVPNLTTNMDVDVSDNLKAFIRLEVSKKFSKNNKKPHSAIAIHHKPLKKSAVPRAVARQVANVSTSAPAARAVRAVRAPAPAAKSVKRSHPVTSASSTPHKKRIGGAGQSGTYQLTGILCNKISNPISLNNNPNHININNLYNLNNSNHWSQLNLFEDTQTIKLMFELIKNIIQICSNYNLPIVDYNSVSNLAFNNISCTTFSPAVNQLLSLGLRFIPKPTDYKLDEIINSFKQFRNKINWSYHILFNPIMQSSTYNSKFRLSTVKIFNKPEMTIVTPIFIKLQKDLNSLVIKHNITNDSPKTEHSALAIINLKLTYPQLKFTQADKNLGLVCMDLTHYNSMVMNHLDDNETYELVGIASNDLKLEIINKVTTKMKSILVYLDKSFDKQEKQFLHESLTYVLPNFHCLPKLHKTPLKGRPIIGSPNWVTTRLSIYLAEKLITVLHPNKFPNILKNTRSLIDKLNEFSIRDLDNLHLVTFDVTSLYTNIDVETLLDILFEYNPKFAMIAEFICHNNYFIYSDKIYRQLGGIAMGTNVAVAFANLYLGCLLDTIIRQHQICLFYYRYIDDGFFLAKGAPLLIESFIQELNSIIPNIKLTHVVSSKSVDFLDLTIFFSPDIFKLQFKTFQKELNKYLYLPPFSYHHKSTISGFVIGELNRYNLTNSTMENVITIRSLFRYRLLKRGYPAYFVDAIYKSKPINLSRPLISRKNLYHNMIPFFIRYTNTPFYKDLVKCFNIHRKKFAHLIDDNQIIMPVYTTSSNLIKLLLNSNITKKQTALLKNHNGS